MTDDKPKRQAFAPVKPLYVDPAQAPDVVRLPPSTIYELEHAGLFPRRRQLSGRRVGFLLRELEEWAESRPVSTILPVAGKKVEA